MGCGASAEARQPYEPAQAAPPDAMHTQQDAQDAAPITDAADAGAAHGAVGIDHVWQRRLQRAMDETVPPVSFEDAVLPLSQHFPEIDFEDLRAIAQGLREAWRERLYSESGGFNLPETYHLDWAIAIRVYTMSDPPVYRIVNREMFNPKRRKPGGNHSISDGLSACMPFIRLLKDALENLPESYVFRGQVRRGVKWSFPSPDDHDPVGYFVVGQRVMWYEFKSTSTKQEVMTREHFCGVTAGPRTIFIIDVLLAFAIKKFSFFQGVESEHEVLLLPLSEFVVVHAARNIIDPHETVSVQRSGFPDTVHLRQVEPVEGRTQEEADTALAREIQQQLDLEHAVEMESKKRKDAEAQQKAEAEARQRVEAEAQQRVKEAESQLKVEENARQKAAEEQARIQAEQDAKRAKEEKKEEGDHVLELPEIVLRKLENAALFLSEEDSLKVLLACIQYGLVKARKGEDKELLMVIGNTGAGKSTLINYLHGCKFQMVRKGSKRIVCVSADSQVSEMMKIGHTNQSMTFIPDLEVDELFTYLDCPGFLDNRGAEINIANAVNIKSAVCLAHAVRVLVLINYNSLEADRGRGLRELLKVLIELFGTIDALRQACSSILLGVSKVPYHSYGEEMTLDDVRGLFEDTTGLDADSVTVLRYLSQRMFIYDPLDGGSESWIGRQGLIKLIQDLPPLREPRYAFHTVLTVEDFEVLRAITRNLHDQILEQMNKDEFERVGISLGSLEEIEQVDNAFVTRLVMEVKTQLSLPLRALEDKAFQNASYENFEEAAGTLIRLQTAAQHLPGRLGDDAAQRHARALAWVEKRKKEVEDMRALMEANKDANKRAQQLEVQMQMLMKQSEADKENIQRLTDAFREQEIKWEQERQKAKTAFEDELRQYQEQMRSASEEEKQALEAQMQQLQQERAMSEKLYEKQRLEEKQRNEKLVADLQQKNAETERKVKEAEEAAAAERQKQLEAAERVRAEEARRKEEEAAKAKAAAEAEAKAKAEAEVKRKEEAAAKQKAAAEAKAKSQAEAKRKEELKAQEEALERAIASGDEGAVVVKRMREHPASAAIQREGCHALWSLTAQSDQNRGQIARVGGIEALLTAMQGHPTDPGVQERACGALRNIALTAENQGQIARLGGIEPLLKAIKDQPTHPGVQEQACAALRSLAHNNPENQGKISKLGGIEPLLKAIKDQPTHPGVQQQACGALCNLAVNPENQGLIARLGGIEALLKVMKDHPGIAEVQQQACWALCNLGANHAENKTLISNLGGIEALVTAMKDHPAHPGVQQQACAALHNLTKNAENQVKIGNLGGIEALVKAMKDHPAHPGVQEQACLALCNLGWSNPAFQRRIKTAGAEDQIRRAMAAANATDNTKKYGQMLLDKLAQC